MFKDTFCKHIIHVRHEMAIFFVRHLMKSEKCAFSVYMSIISMKMLSEVNRTIVDLGCDSFGVRRCAHIMISPFPKVRLFLYFGFSFCSFVDLICFFSFALELFSHRIFFPPANFRSVASRQRQSQLVGFFCYPQWICLSQNCVFCETEKKDAKKKNEHDFN